MDVVSVGRYVDCVQLICRLTHRSRTVPVDNFVDNSQGIPKWQVVPGPSPRGPAQARPSMQRASQSDASVNAVSVICCRTVGAISSARG